MKRRDLIYVEISGMKKRQVSTGLAKPTIRESKYRVYSYRPCMRFADHPLSLLT